MNDSPDATQRSYDRVAEDYAQHFADELDHKPLERQLLETMAQTVTGRIADVGCGPGHAARFLQAAGADVIGFDLSPAMVDQAKQLSPDIAFFQADMRALPLEDASLGGIVAFYCLIHISREEIPAVLAEFRRVLQPDGALLLSFHIGEDVVHRDEWWGQTVNLDFHFFTIDEMTRWLAEAGYEIADIVERTPYPEIEVQTQRGYITAMKRAGE